MKRNTLMSAAVSVLSFLFLFPAVTTPVVAQERRDDIHFAGVLNDYTPTDPTINGSPYEMHGQWSVDIDDRNHADFYADMTMSDFGTTNGVLDGTKGGQNSHTHHIRLTHVKVTWNMVGCPTYSPATTAGFQFSGTVSLITGNGSKAAFEMTPTPTSTLQVCVTGGTEVPFSNMSMVFGGPATKHFGTQAIHGAVRKAVVEDPEPRDRHDHR